MEKEVKNPGLLIISLTFKFCVILSCILIVVGFFFKGTVFSLSIFAGSVVACGSFYLLKRDLERIIERVASNEQAQNLEKIKFFLKFYGRLSVIALLLFVLVAKAELDIIGLMVGLSSMMISVIFVVLVKAKSIYSLKKMEEV